MKDERGNTKAKSLVVITSFILHPSSFILHLSSSSVLFIELNQHITLTDILTHL